MATPDQVPDIVPPHLGSWKSYVLNLLDTKSSEGGVRFYNPIRIPQISKPNKADISWLIFPNKLMGLHDEARWAEADRNQQRRDAQDEYCEWSVQRDAEGKVVKVVFSCELPEYWKHLAKSPDYLLALYRQLNPTCDIKMEDLYIGDKYNQFNKWNIGTNSGCIVHMIHPNNALDDGVELVARATIIRRDKENQCITDGPELVRLAGYTSWQRNSDPHIAQEVNKLSRDGKILTMSNPIGMYFEPFFGKGRFRLDNGSEAPRFWTFSRGQGDKFSRLVFEVPAGAGCVLGDIIDVKSGRKIQYGGQLADHLKVKVTAQAIPFIPRYSSTMWSFIAGRNDRHEPMSPEFIQSTITDYFGQKLITTPVERHPLTLRQILDKLPAFTWVPFVVHEGLHIPSSHPASDLSKLRLIIVATPNAPTQKPHHTPPNCRIADVNILKARAFKTDTLFIVGGSNLDKPDGFLQCAGFDPNKGWFNFYERANKVDGTNQPGWLYFGCSKDAFDADTKGKGIFCGHVNGALVMKELERPWVHWHSSMSPDLASCIDRGNPLAQQEVMMAPGKADDLEVIVIDGIRKWFEKRRQLDFESGNLREVYNVRRWVAHVLTSTTVNIGASTVDTKSVLNAGKDFPTPKGLFYNEDCLHLVLKNLAMLVPRISSVSAAAYKNSLQSMGLRILDDKGGVSTYDEGQSPFIILTPSREDTEGVRIILENRLLPRRCLAAMLMVDFCNPVYSWRRAALMEHIPETIFCNDKNNYDTLADKILQSVNASARKNDPNSPEAELIRYLAMDDYNLSSQVAAYITKVDKRLQTQSGLEDYIKLSESRRRIFRPPPGSREEGDGLAEFAMTLPYVNGVSSDASPVEMTPLGELREVANIRSLLKNHENQYSRFSSSKGCPFAR